MGEIVLCAETESLIRPWMIGLDGKDLSSYRWLKAFSKAVDAREFIRSTPGIDEVWVISADDIEPVNLAAAIRKDDPNVPIALILSEASGSTLSRAHAAGILGVLSIKEFVERFSAQAHMHRAIDGSANDPLAQARFADNRRCTPCDQTFAPGAEDPRPSPSAMPINQEDPRFVHAQEKARSIACSDDVATFAHDIPLTQAWQKAQCNPEGRSAFVLSVVSGSGGAGKSVVSAMLAFASALQNVRTAIIDCDLQFGDLKILTNRKDASTIDDCIADPSRIASIAQEARNGKPALIAAPRRLEASEILSNHIGVVIDECSRYFDTIIVNTGSSWTETHAVLLERSSSVLVLVDQRASSIFATKHAVELCQRLGIAIGNFIYCLNRCSKTSLFQGVDIVGILDGAPVLEIQDGGVEVEEMAGAGFVDELIASKNAFAESMRSIANRVLPDPEQMRRGARTHIKADPLDEFHGASRREKRLMKRQAKSERRRSRKNTRKYALHERDLAVRAGAL